MTHPIEAYKRNISQGYGEKNPTWYPVTGHHIGVDYVCPANTKVVAPIDGEVITSGKSRSLGNYCYYEYQLEGKTYVERWLHLSLIPRIGTYKQGEQVAYTGNSGSSTAPHFHQDIWRDEVRLDLLTAKNWTELTVDPEAHYDLKV